MENIKQCSPTKVNTKQEVIQVIKNNWERFADFGVLEIGLFGSFVREEADSHSDIDLLVSLKDNSYQNLCQLIDFTQSLFMDRKVDLITEGGINEINGIYICKEVEYVT